MSTKHGPLDIGMIVQGWFPDAGGIESHTRDLARELNRRGHRVHALALDGSGVRAPYTTRDELVADASLRRMAYEYHDHRALADIVENRRAEEVVHAWLAETPCDLVHVHHLTGFGLGVLRALAEVGMPCAMTLHDYWPLCPRGQMLRVDGIVCDRPEPDPCAACLARTWAHLLPSSGGEQRGPAGRPIANDLEAAGERTRFALEMLARPGVLLTPSLAAKQVYVSAGVPASRIEICPNGIEVEGLALEVERLRREHPRRDAEIRLAVLGSVLPSKGALELARAFVLANAPRLTLEIHGALPSYHGDSSYIDALRALAASDSRIRVHGPFGPARLPQILASVDAVAAPSIWNEVYGLTVREAAAAGLPVLVSEAGDLPALVLGGAPGDVVRGRGAQPWVDALVRLASTGASHRPTGLRPPGLRRTAEMTDQILAAYGRLRPQPTFAAEPRRRSWLRRLFGS